MALEYRDGKHLVIEADLPGLVAERDIEIWITHDVLHVRARRVPGPEPGRRPSDARYGAFARDIAVPAGTAAEEVSASYRDGTLAVRLPWGGALRGGAVHVPVDA